MAATINPKVTEGPAFCAAAAAVLTNNPAPIMAPMPSATRAPEPSVRLSPFSESPASAINWLIDFFTNKLILVSWF